MRVLEISCSYFPDKIGGTETYVRALAKGLVARGHEVSVSYVQDLPVKDAPVFKIRSYVHDRIPVYVLEKNTFSRKTHEIYFQSRNSVRLCFTRLLEQLKPDIVHFHHLSSTDIIDAAEVAKEQGVATVLTYHTPMMTCCQGQTLYRGAVPCTGKIEFLRCLECVQGAYSIPRFLAWAWARMPFFLSRRLGLAVASLGFKSPLATWLQLPWMERERVGRLRYGLSLFDRFVAVAGWVRSLLLVNGIPADKITLSRQGVEVVPERKGYPAGSLLRVVFIGRIVPYKGLDVLCRAVSMLERNCAVEAQIFGLPQDPREQRYLEQLKHKYARERRLIWKGALDPDKKFETLMQADVVVIPSLWQETGPLVLLEAWAAGVPVFGSRRGAIAELLEDGRGGALFEPGNFQELASLLKKATQDRAFLGGLKKTVPAPKTMHEVVSDMETLYRQLLAQKGVRQ